MDAVERGRMLHPLQLNGVASTLTVPLIRPTSFPFETLQISAISNSGTTRYNSDEVDTTHSHTVDLSQVISPQM